MSNYKYIFFDIYGTLAGFYPEREKIQQKILSKNQIYLTEEQISMGYKFADEFMAFQKKTNPLRNLSSIDKKNFFSKYEQKILEANGIFVKDEKSWKIWEQISKEPYDLKIFDDVSENLKWLASKGINSAGITNMDITGEKLLNNLSLGGLLKFIVTSLDTHSEKPDSKIFLFSMEKAKVKADESIFIGDQIESDIMGAKNAGMFPILIDRYGYYEDFSDALKIKNLDDLKKIF